MWILENGEAMNRQYPTTFEIPDQIERESLKPGDHAKLVFLDYGYGERMWVHVDEITNVGYIGTLDNQPLVIEGLEYGDPVSFTPAHVIDIMRPKPKRERPARRGGKKRHD